MSYCWIGALLGIAEFIRPDAILVMIAVLVTLFVTSARRIKRIPSLLNRLTRSVVAPSIVVISYVALTCILSLSLNAFGLANPDQHPEEGTTSKILMGTDTETAGRCGDDYQSVAIEESQKNGSSYQEAAWNIILERISDPGYMAELQLRKLQALWWSNSETFNLNKASDTILDNINTTEKAYVFLLLATNLLFYFKLYRNRFNYRTVECMLPFILILLLTMCAYVFIEVQPRYLYFLYIVLFITGIPSLERRSSDRF